MSSFNPALLKQLKQSLHLQQTPCQWQQRRVYTTECAVEFQPHVVLVSRPGKACRQLPYHKVRLFQLLNWLKPQSTAQGS